MKMIVVSFLRYIGIVRADFLVERTAYFPEVAPAKPGKLVLVADNGMQKWACFPCPGGCGQSISLSLNPSRRPRWSIVTDFWFRPTISPSIHQQNACGCHFWIEKGQIEWCPGGRPTRMSDKYQLPKVQGWRSRLLLGPKDLG
jgi:hypothetical protein